MQSNFHNLIHNQSSLNIWTFIREFWVVYCSTPFKNQRSKRIQTTDHLHQALEVISVGLNKGQRALRHVGQRRGSADTALWSSTGRRGLKGGRVAKIPRDLYKQSVNIPSSVFAWGIHDCGYRSQNGDVCAWDCGNTERHQVKLHEKRGKRLHLNLKWHFQINRSAFCFRLLKHSSDRKCSQFMEAAAAVPSTNRLIALSQEARIGWQTGMWSTVMSHNVCTEGREVFITAVDAEEGGERQCGTHSLCSEAGYCAFILLLDAHLLWLPVKLNSKAKDQFTEGLGTVMFE